MCTAEVRDAYTVDAWAMFCQISSSTLGDFFTDTATGYLDKGVFMADFMSLHPGVACNMIFSSRNGLFITECSSVLPGGTDWNATEVEIVMPLRQLLAEAAPEVKVSVLRMKVMYNHQFSYRFKWGCRMEHVIHMCECHEEAAMLLFDASKVAERFERALTKDKYAMQRCETVSCLPSASRWDALSLDRFAQVIVEGQTESADRL